MLEADVRTDDVQEAVDPGRALGVGAGQAGDDTSSAPAVPSLSLLFQAPDPVAPRRRRATSPVQAPVERPVVDEAPRVLVDDTAEDEAAEAAANDEERATSRILGDVAERTWEEMLPPPEQKKKKSKKAAAAAAAANTHSATDSSPLAGSPIEAPPTAIAV